MARAGRFRCPECLIEVDIAEHGVSHLAIVGCVQCEEHMEHVGGWVQKDGGWVYAEYEDD